MNVGQLKKLLAEVPDNVEVWSLIGKGRLSTCKRFVLAEWNSDRTQLIIANPMGTHLGFDEVADGFKVLKST